MFVRSLVIYRAGHPETALRTEGPLRASAQARAEARAYRAVERERVDLEVVVVRELDVELEDAVGAAHAAR